jgi:hypothetical protein
MPRFAIPTSEDGGLELSTMSPGRAHVVCVCYSADKNHKVDIVCRICQPRCASLCTSSSSLTINVISLSPTPVGDTRNHSPHLASPLLNTRHTRCAKGQGGKSSRAASSRLLHSEAVPISARNTTYRFPPPSLVWILGCLRLRFRVGGRIAK